MTLKYGDSTCFNKDYYSFFFYAKTKTINGRKRRKKPHLFNKVMQDNINLDFTCHNSFRLCQDGKRNPPFIQGYSTYYRLCPRDQVLSPEEVRRWGTIREFPFSDL